MVLDERDVRVSERVSRRLSHLSGIDHLLGKAEEERAQREQTTARTVEEERATESEPVVEEEAGVDDEKSSDKLVINLVPVTKDGQTIFVPEGWAKPDSDWFKVNVLGENIEGVIRSFRTPKAKNGMLFQPEIKTSIAQQFLGVLRDFYKSVDSQAASLIDQKEFFTALCLSGGHNGAAAWMLTHLPNT